MNNTNSKKSSARDRKEEDDLVYVSLNMGVTKSESSDMETAMRFLGMRDMEGYCKYSMLKIAEAHSY